MRCFFFSEDYYLSLSFFLMNSLILLSTLHSFQLLKALTVLLLGNAQCPLKNYLENG